MSTTDARPERKQTDESLAAERATADQALSERGAAVEQKADVVVERAREEADEVLSAARARADEQPEPSASPELARAVVARERAQEDQVVLAERADADDALRRERVASRARLLPLERDETDRRLLTERARSDDALANRDDFLGMVSHDLRDLLCGVLLEASLIAELTSKDPSDQRACTAARRIERSAGRMGRLIGDLVDVASIDAGTLAVSPRAVDAAAVVQAAVETWGTFASAKGITLESVANGPVPARLDTERTLQILGNLITNAVKFSPRGGTIVIVVEALEGEVRVSVEDTGVGIPSDQLEAIFERFWQVGKNDRRGLGLGLHISRCLVQAQGGRIWAESQLGAGSTVSFTVPHAR